MVGVRARVTGGLGTPEQDLTGPGLPETHLCSLDKQVLTGSGC
jgi:hypothetical protein